MTGINDNSSPFDRQLGVASTRMDEHDRRLKSQEEVAEQLRRDLREIEKAQADFGARLQTEEIHTKEIRTTLSTLSQKCDQFSGFLAGFKSASVIWYAAMTLIGSVVGFVISKLFFQP